MKKYYIGLMVLMAISLGAVAYTISQAGVAKADKATDQAVEQIGSHLDSYIADNGSIPKSLSDAGMKDVPTTVTYQAIDTSSYKVCFNYKTAASGFDAGWTSLLTGGLTGASQSDSSSSGDNGYFDGSVEFSHKKGLNCQTVTHLYGDVPLNSETDPSAGGSPECLGDTSGYQASGSATVTEVDTANSTITFSPDNQYLYDNKYNLLPAISSKTYTAATLFCNSGFDKSTVSSVHAGATVQIYLQTAGDASLARVDAL